MYQEEDQEADQDHHGSVAQANNYLFRAARDQEHGCQCLLPMSKILHKLQSI